MTDLLILAAAILAAGFSAGFWTRSSIAAREALAQSAAADARQALTFGREARRLAEETITNRILGDLINDARNDRDTALPALGLRDAQRLNQIR